MWADKIGYEEAFRALKQTRVVCSPNLGFIMQLQDWERILNNPPNRSMLFRMGPHSDKEKALVARSMTASVLSSQSTKSSTPSPMSKAKGVGFSDNNTTAADTPAQASDVAATPRAPVASSLRRASLTSMGDASNNDSGNMPPLPASGMGIRKARAKSITAKPPVKFSIQNINKKEVYILQVPSANIIFIWIGKECPRLDEYVVSAESYVSLATDLIPTLKGYKVIKINSQSKEESEALTLTTNSQQQKAQGENELLFWKTIDGMDVNDSEMNLP